MSSSLHIFAPQRKYKKTETDPLDTSTKSSSGRSLQSDRKESEHSIEILSNLKTGIEDASNAIAGLFSKAGEKVKESNSSSPREVVDDAPRMEPVQEGDEVSKKSETKNKHAHFREDYILVEESKQRGAGEAITDKLVEQNETGPNTNIKKNTGKKTEPASVKLLPMPKSLSPSFMFAFSGLVLCMAVSSSLETPFQTVYSWITIILSLVVTFFVGQSRALETANANITLLLQQDKKNLLRITTLEKELKAAQDAASESARTRASSRTNFLRSHASLVGKLTTRGEGEIEVDTWKDLLLPEGFFSTLQEPFGDEPPEICPFLSNRLLKIENLSRHPENSQKTMPLCTLRGMDFLLTDSPEEPIYKNRYLNRVGLRSKPMLVLNALMPWANITLYYEMPEWVKNFDEIEELDSDAPDVKSFKRFLKNDHDYRTNRLQFLPCIVEGPAAVRMVAPPKKELIGRAILLPDVHWFQENEYVDKMGKKHCAVLEGTTDVSGSPLTRSLAKIFRRSIGSIKADVAWVVDKPELQKEDEPKCCIGIFQLDKVDVATAPILPSPTEEENLYHASVVASRMGQ